MDTAIQILIAGLTLGAMYATSSVSLSLVWGSLNLLNMAQGALLTLGGYVAYTAAATIGLTGPLSLLLAVLAGGVAGALIYYCVVQFMLESANFETNVIIATVGIALVVENLILRVYGAYPLDQPVGLEGGFNVAHTHIPYQNILILLSSIVLMIGIALILGRTRIGRAIRATAQSREAALLMGVPVKRVFVQVLVIGGMLASASGIMLSTITSLAPTMGYDPMLKAFIICVIAGLGNIYGALAASFILGAFEAWVDFAFGVRFGFPALLGLVIVALIWRPYGVFNRKSVLRL